MRIKSVHLKNLGPVTELTIQPGFTSEGFPIPIAIVGQNGSGKSLTLAVVLDAAIEARRKCFRELQEVGATDYLRLSSKNYIQHLADYSHAQAIFATSDGDVDFNEVVSRIAYSDFEKENPDLTALPELQNSEFRDSGFYKHISITETQKKHTRKLVFLYFPYFRYETAYWMSEKAKVDFVKQKDYHGESKLNPIRTNIIDETKRWILNVLLDRELYERKTGNLNLGGASIFAFFGYEGPNTQLFNLVNEIVFTMLRAKSPDVVSARIGIGPKGKREIAVFATKQGKQEEVVAPDISQLSSGELMTLGLATEIIRSYELIKGAPPNDLSDVTGIVLIDEIDLHLHVSFQKAVLPQIIRKFKNVQFLFTTHSPFFLLGMAESGPIDIFSLPIGNKISTEEFEEFQVGYDVFVSSNDQFKSRYDELQARVAHEARPLIITEGKTDWKHLKTALHELQRSGECLDVDIAFFEYENDVNMGDTKLSQMCEHMATLPQQRKVVFLFDRDNPSIVKRMSSESDDFKNWGNGVHSICLPVPPHREGYKNLSIELYYRDDTLRMADPKSGKRLWFTNEIEIVTRPTTGQRVFRTLETPNESEEFEKKVFDQPADQIVDATGKPVGLSKSAFAEMVGQAREKNAAIDFTPFRNLFDLIGKISRQA